MSKFVAASAALVFLVAGAGIADAHTGRARPDIGAKLELSNDVKSSTGKFRTGIVVAVNPQPLPPRRKPRFSRRR